MKNSTLDKLNVFLILALVVITTSCDGSSSENTEIEKPTSSNSEFRVTGVNDYEFKFNDNDAGGAIHFSSEEFKQCRLSFIQSNFKQGYTTRITILGKGDIDLTCMSEKELFTLNDSGSTYTEMTVSELSDKAVITLDFSLFSMKSKAELTKNNIVLELNSMQLKQLIN